MAEYTLLDQPQFQSYYGSKQAPQNGGYDGTPTASKDPMMDKSTAQAAAYGAQSGGLSGALTAGGVSSLLTNGAAAGGPYAIAGGLILSQIEAAQKQKAQAEAQRVADERQRMANLQSSYEKMANQRYRV